MMVAVRSQNHVPREGKLAPKTSRAVMLNSFVVSTSVQLKPNVSNANARTRSVRWIVIVAKDYIVRTVRNARRKNTNNKSFQLIESNKTRQDK